MSCEKWTKIKMEWSPRHEAVKARGRPTTRWTSKEKQQVGSKMLKTVIDGAILGSRRERLCHDDNHSWVHFNSNVNPSIIFAYAKDCEFSNIFLFS